MKAMVLKEITRIHDNKKPGRKGAIMTSHSPLEFTDLPVPTPGPKDILIKISACGVCHTELDQIEGRIRAPRLPIVPGHQPVGIVEKIGENVTSFKKGDRAGATWIYSSCGKCSFCTNELENLCYDFKATGSHADGGYAEYMVISENYALNIPVDLGDLNHVAPLMCSGTVGYRSLMLTGMKNGKTLGLYGFGSAHHLVIQMAEYLYPASKRFVFARNPKERKLALDLGADWVGDIDERPLEKTDCAIDTTPVWRPVAYALENLKRGGRLVMNLIRKENYDRKYLLKFDYEKHLWMEKEIKTVANITRKDGLTFIELAKKIEMKPKITAYPLEVANQALLDLKVGKTPGSKILTI